MHMLAVIISGIFLLLIIYMLFIPVGISFQYCSESVSSGPLVIRFYPFTISHSWKSSRKPSRTANAVQAKTKSNYWRILKEDLVTVYQVSGVCLQFLKGMLERKYHFARISLQGGLGAPDITGLLTGLLASAKPALGKKCALIFHPDFTTLTPQGRMKIEAGFQIYGFLMETMWLFGRLPKMKLIRMYRKLTKRS